MPKMTLKKINKTWTMGIAALLVMCLWHLSEVQMSVQACGDKWLTGNYLALAAALLGTGRSRQGHPREARRYDRYPWVGCAFVFARSEGPVRCGGIRRGRAGISPGGRGWILVGASYRVQAR